MYGSEQSCFRRLRPKQSHPNASIEKGETQFFSITILISRLHQCHYQPHKNKFKIGIYVYISFS